MSIPATSNLRPSTAQRQLRNDYFAELNRKRRLEEAEYGVSLEDLHRDQPLRSREPEDYEEREVPTYDDGGDLAMLNAGHIHSSATEPPLASQESIIADSQRQPDETIDEHSKAARSRLARASPLLGEDLPPGSITDGVFVKPTLPASQSRAKHRTLPRTRTWPPKLPSNPYASTSSTPEYLERPDHTPLKRPRTEERPDIYDVVDSDNEQQERSAKRAKVTKSPDVAPMDRQRTLGQHSKLPHVATSAPSNIISHNTTDLADHEDHKSDAVMIEDYTPEDRTPVKANIE
ncbi:hypothetical protein LTR16_006788, partial [Cryomyces antarcticus]